MYPYWQDNLTMYEDAVVTLEKDTYYCWLHAVVPFIACEGEVRDEETREKI